MDCGDMTLVMHALLRKLGTTDVELTHDEILRAADDCASRDLHLVEEPRGEGLWHRVRIRSLLKFSEVSRG